MKVRSVSLVLVCAVVAVAPGAAATTAEVTMPGRLFAPRQLDVLVGTVVTWRNTDHSTHTVTEDDDAFDSGHIRPGGEFTMTFTKTGAFRFHCTIHRFMRGSVSVFDVVLRGPDEPLPAGRRAVLEGIAPEGVTQVVLERVLPGPAQSIARAMPASDGSFRFVVRAPEPRRYRVHADAAKSPLVRVRVAPRVAIASRPGAIGVHALPSRPGAPVVLQRYDRELFAFVTVARGRLDASSRALVAHRPQGKEYLRAVVRGTAGWSDGVSRSIVVR